MKFKCTITPESTDREVAEVLSDMFLHWFENENTRRAAFAIVNDGKGTTIVANGCKDGILKTLISAERYIETIRTELRKTEASGQDSN